MSYCKCIELGGVIDWYRGNKNTVWPKCYGEVTLRGSVSQGSGRQEREPKCLCCFGPSELPWRVFDFCLRLCLMSFLHIFFFPAVIVKICFSPLTMCRLAWLWLTIQQLLYRMGKKCMFSYAFLKIILNAIFCFLFLWWNLFRSKFTQSYFDWSM